MKHSALTILFLLMATCPAGAADSVKKDPKAAVEDAAARHERLAREFLDFQRGTGRLARLLASSAKPADREQAGVLQRALEVMRREGTAARLERLTACLKRMKVLAIADVALVMELSKSVANDLATLDDILHAEARDDTQTGPVAPPLPAVPTGEAGRLLARLRAIAAAEAVVYDTFAELHCLLKDSGRTPLFDD